MTLKQIINSITIVIILTLSIYHLFIYFGRNQFKDEIFNLFFALTGVFAASYILFLTFIPPSRLSILLVKAFTFLIVFFSIATFKNLIPFPNTAIITYNISLGIIFVNVLLTLPVLFLGKSWYFSSKIFMLFFIIPTIAILIFIINTIFFIFYSKINTGIIGRMIIIATALYAFNSLTSMFGSRFNIDFLKHNFMFLGLFYFVLAYGLSIKFNKEFQSLKELSNCLEQKVEDRTAELEQEKENKTRFFTNAAHETKTPLTLIKNYLDEVIQKHNLGRDQDMRVVRDNVLKLETDMLNFLDSEKIERGEMVYRHDQVIDFSQFTRDKIDLFKPVFEKKALDFQCEIRDKIYLKANSQSLDRVLNNLFDNAVKYTPQGGQVKVQLKLSRRKILLSVTNSGSILCDTEIKDIFNPYYQVNREKSNAQGMGLGLYIVKNIVQSLEGEIEVQSSIEEGTTVFIKLKSHALKKSDLLSPYQLEQPRDAKVLDLENREQNHFHKNILLVEDDLPLLEILYRHLKEDYNVFCAVNGRDALDLLESMVDIDLIISDIMMDVMDGYELLHRVPRSHVHVPFLFITAKTTQAAKTAGLKQGAVDFIYKPFTIAELKHKIKNHLDQAAKIHARAKKSMDHRLDSHKKKVNRAEEFELLCKKYKLTSSEIKIVSLFGEGFDNKDLARKLDVSVRTVHNHTRNIFKKVEVRSRIELLNKMKFFHG